MGRHVIKRRALIAALAITGLLGPDDVRAAPPVFGAPVANDGLVSAWSSVELVASDGAHLRLSDIRAPLVLVNLWANWCPGCLIEFASMRRMASIVGPSNLDVILVSHPTNWEADKAFSRRGSLPFLPRTFAPGTPQSIVNTAFTSDSAGKTYMVPQTLAFAGGGRSLLWSKLGGSETWDSPDEVADMQDLVAKAKKAA